MATANAVRMLERFAPSRPYSLGNPRRQAKGASRSDGVRAPSLDTSKQLATTYAKWLKEQETPLDKYENRERLWRQLTHTVYGIWQQWERYRAELRDLGTLGVTEACWLQDYDEEKAKMQAGESPAYDAWLEKFVADWMRANPAAAEFPAKSEAYFHALYLEHWKKRNKPRGVNAKVLTWEKQYFQLLNCQGEWIGYRADCCGDATERVAVPIGCNHRLCPLCSWHRCQQAQERAKKLFDRIEHPQFLTLTIPNLKTIAKKRVHYYRKQVTKLLDWYRKMGIFQGGVYAIETTYNRAEKSWHLHAHVMVDATTAFPSADWKVQFAGRSIRAFDLLKLAIEFDWTRLWVRGHKHRPSWAFGFPKQPRMNASKDTLDDERFAFELWVRGCAANETLRYDRKLQRHVPRTDLSAAEMCRRQAWNKANRRVVWMKTVTDRDKAVKEVLKYITKSADFSDLPECVEAFYDAVKGARMIQTFGTWYGVKLDEPTGEVDRKSWSKMKCSCGENIWARDGVYGRHKVQMDATGQWRVKSVFNSRSADTVARPTIRALGERVDPEAFNFGANGASKWQTR